MINAAIDPVIAAYAATGILFWFGLIGLMVYEAVFESTKEQVLNGDRFSVLMTGFTILLIGWPVVLYVIARDSPR